jgi:hypothetical protein
MSQAAARVRPASSRRTAAEDLVKYAVGIAFLIVALAALGALVIVRRENRPESRTSLATAVRALRRSPLVVAAASGECPCGGVLGPTGQQSRRYGPLQACTDCGQTYTEDGSKIVQRKRPPGERRVRRVRRSVDQ